MIQDGKLPVVVLAVVLPANVVLFPIVLPPTVPVEVPAEVGVTPVVGRTPVVEEPQLEVSGYLTGFTLYMVRVIVLLPCATVSFESLRFYIAHSAGLLFLKFVLLYFVVLYLC